MLLEHYPEERNDCGRLVLKETWDRVSFASRTPRKVWFSGRERVSLGESDWHPLPPAEVEEMIGPIR